MMSFVTVEINFIQTLVGKLFRDSKFDYMLMLGFKLCLHRFVQNCPNEYKRVQMVQNCKNVYDNIQDVPKKRGISECY